MVTLARFRSLVAPLGALRACRCACVARGHHAPRLAFARLRPLRFSAPLRRPASVVALGYPSACPLRWGARDRAPCSARPELPRPRLAVVPLQCIQPRRSGRALKRALLASLTPAGGGWLFPRGGLWSLRPCGRSPLRGFGCSAAARAAINVAATSPRHARGKFVPVAYACIPAAPALARGGCPASTATASAAPAAGGAHARQWWRGVTRGYRRPLRAPLSAAPRPHADAYNLAALRARGVTRGALRRPHRAPPLPLGAFDVSMGLVVGYNAALRPQGAE